DRFILRDQSATRTVGGGIVLDALPPATRRDTPVRRAELDALEHADPHTAFASLLACSPAGIDVGWFERNYNLTAERIAEIVGRANATVIGKEVRKALPQDAVATLKRSILASLAQFHRQSPQAPGAVIEDLHERLAPQFAAATFLAILREIAETHAVAIAGSLVRVPQHVATANPADEKLWRRVEPALGKAQFAMPLLRDLASDLRIDEKVLRDFLHRKSQTGELVRVTGDRFYPRTTLARLAAVAQATAAATADGRFSAAQFRDAAEVGRSLAIEILECLDRIGVTQRIGDARTMRNDFVPILGAAPLPSQRSAPPPPKR
ncbi:MAG: SelB C-terminal domain-containing protein, partial [Casimicrobiaceae bacterium]